MQIIKDKIQKGSRIVDPRYKVGDKVMLNNNAAIKYENLHRDTFEITQYWTNDTVTLQCEKIKSGYNIRWIKPYTTDTNVEYIITKIYV